MPDPAILLFDGVCNLCHGAVQFVIDRDPSGRFSFASLQSERGRALLAQHGLTIPAGDPDTVVLLEGGRAHTRSSAALRVLRGLRWPWPLGYAAIVVPRPLRDAIYDVVARRRYGWFGRTETCRVPTPALRARLLD